MPTAVLGIDTSAYTASLAVVDRAGIRFQQRLMVPVAGGQRGVRPQVAVFAHLRGVPALIAQALERLSPTDLALVAVSTRPRPVTDSYLPSFEVGHRLAEVLALSLHVPLVATTHQEGHIRAAMVGAGGPYRERFYALHASGGTTELLSAEWHSAGGLAKIRFLGGSDDLYAGQFVDRVGVRLGGPFPAGPYLERLATPDSDYPPLPVSLPRYHDGAWWISFSGPEAEAGRRIERGDRPALVAAAVEAAVADALAALAGKFRAGPLLLAGGVAANQRIRNRLSARLLERDGWELYFAPPELCRDNAVGVAYMGRDRIQ